MKISDYLFAALILALGYFTMGCSGVQYTFRIDDISSQDRVQAQRDSSSPQEEGRRWVK